MKGAASLCSSLLRSGVWSIFLMSSTQRSESFHVHDIFAWFGFLDPSLIPISLTEAYLRIVEHRVSFLSSLQWFSWFLSVSDGGIGTWAVHSVLDGLSGFWSSYGFELRGVFTCQCVE